MNDSPADSASAVPPERLFASPVRAWELVFLGLFAVCMLAAAWIQSHKEFLSNDELITTILASNPSFSEMWNTIRRGGELNPPLYFIMEWVLVRCFGTGDFAMRALSGISVTLAGWVLYFTLRRLTGPSVAAVAIALVLGLSRDVFHFAKVARYYGVLFLLVSLGVLLLIRLTADRPVTRRVYLLIFAVHWAMVYLHLYGLIYSGVLFVAMAMMEILRGRLRWGVLGAVVAAWVSFCAWLPATFQQFKSVSQGVYTPPNFLKLGWFVEELALQTPMALVLLLLGLLGGLALISGRPSRATAEANECFAPVGWAALAVAALGLLSVPVCTWLASHVMTPAPFMRSYAFPAIAGWVLIAGLVLVAFVRLAPAKSPFQFRAPPWLWTLAWTGVLIFCLGYQPARARKNPPRPATAFVDADFGHKDLPMVFENSLDFLPRAHYGQGREYVLLIDRAAAEADSGWYTKSVQRFFQGWYPQYHQAKISYVADLPEDFLAVDDDYTKTFEWVFTHHPELTKQLLGARKVELEMHGDERIYLVHNSATAKRH